MAKTQSEVQKDYDDRRKREGWVRFSVWGLPEHRAMIRKYADDLAREKLKK